MTLLFWNLKKDNNNAEYVISIMREKGIDIGIFAEYTATDWDTVLYELGPSFSRYDGFGGCDKVTLICKSNYAITVYREQSRYTLYLCSTAAELYIIAGIHLPSNRDAEPEHRKNVIRDLVRDISEIERLLNCSQTIVIGDFNASPFDSELIQKDAFNAVLFKKLIESNEYIRFEHREYRRFYNPMLTLFSESPAVYGSHYYSNGINSLYWFFYDQIIYRKPLITKIESISYIDVIKGRNLIRRKKPDNTISDHLPLLAKLKG